MSISWSTELKLTISEDLNCEAFSSLDVVINNSGDSNFPDYQCDDFKSFDKVATYIFSLSPYPIPRTRLQVLKIPASRASAELYRPEFSFGYNAKIDNLKHNEAIFIHELGHIVFTEYLKQHTIRSRTTPLPFVSQSPQVSPSVMLPYTELFADILAVITLENPSVIAEVLINDEKRICRNMLNDINNAIEDIAGHCTFSGLRKYIYKNYLEPAKTIDQKRIAIDVLLRILTNETIQLQKKMHSAESLSNIDWQIEFNILKTALEGYIESSK